MQIDIVRAWKDVTYRSNLSAEELARMPEHPAGSLELDEAELDQVMGGTGWWTPLGPMTIQISLMICIIIDA